MPRPTTSRRTLVSGLAGALGAAVGGVIVSGCETDDLKPHDDASPTLTPSASAGGQTPDERLVAQVGDDIRTVLADVVTARRLAGLRQPLAPLLRTHRRHLAALEEKDGWSGGVSTTDPAAALVTVRDAEQTLGQQLATAAGQAESGTLAALLASMSASVAQHLAALPAAAS